MNLFKTSQLKVEDVIAYLRKAEAIPLVAPLPLNEDLLFSSES